MKGENSIMNNTSKLTGRGHYQPNPEAIRELAQPLFPLQSRPLIHCLTNEVTMESMANALLAVGASPVMCQEPFQAERFAQTADASLLNLGMVNQEKAWVLRTSAETALAAGKPVVLDLVGVSSQPLLLKLGRKLAAAGPMLIKGNHSEMRTWLDLPTAGQGVDAGEADQAAAALDELAQAMAAASRESGQVLASTGVVDLVASAGQVTVLKNGVEWLGSFTGSGDIVGSLMAALAGDGRSLTQAAAGALTYFNRAGEAALATLNQHQAIASFKTAVLDQLTLLMQDDQWPQAIDGGFYENDN